MNWQRHDGGDRPCPPEQKVYFGIVASPRPRGIVPEPVEARKLRWPHQGNVGDIIWWSPA